MVAKGTQLCWLMIPSDISAKDNLSIGGQVVNEALQNRFCHILCIRANISINLLSGLGLIERSIVWEVS